MILHKGLRKTETLPCRHSVPWLHKPWRASDAALQLLALPAILPLAAACTCRDAVWQGSAQLGIRANSTCLLMAETIRHCVVLSEVTSISCTFDIS